MVTLDDVQSLALQLPRGRRPATACALHVVLGEVAEEDAVGAAVLDHHGGSSESDE